MSWMTYEPEFDGDAPIGISLDTHVVYNGETKVESGLAWMAGSRYHYSPRATYEQVKAWHIANCSPVPPKPVDYEAWRPVLEAGGWSVDTPLSNHDKSEIDDLIMAFRLAQSIPACMEDVKG